MTDDFKWLIDMNIYDIMGLRGWHSFWDDLMFEAVKSSDLHVEIVSDTSTGIIEDVYFIAGG